MGFQNVISFIRELYGTQDFIPLHEPRFLGNEKKYVADAIDSTFVSSVGAYVDQFERELASFVGAKHCVATSNGTSALHLAILVAGVSPSDEVITQPLTFVATCNAIRYAGAKPVFVDVDTSTLGMSPIALRAFLEANTVVQNGRTVNKSTGNTISACIPMHTFGFPCAMDEIKSVCDEFNLALIEDAAEALGSYSESGGRHVGAHGSVSAFSFNGNKVITAGGGGAIITDSEELAIKAKHLSTTAKVPHKWEYVHDHVGFNYRMPNLNAALVCAQLENLPEFLIRKRNLAREYEAFFASTEIQYLIGPSNTEPNYWLNAVLFDNVESRDRFLKETNECGVMTRPIWKLMNELEMYSSCDSGPLHNSKDLASRVVNLPSSVI